MSTVPRAKAIKRARAAALARIALPVMMIGTSTGLLLGGMISAEQGNYMLGVAALCAALPWPRRSQDATPPASHSGPSAASAQASQDRAS